MGAPAYSPLVSPVTYLNSTTFVSFLEQKLQLD